MSDTGKATTGQTTEAKYKDTVNLPKTDFPMKGNLSQLEPRLLAWWEEKGTYKALLSRNDGAPSFFFHDGPPYANGHLHQGHALNKVLKDIVVKYRNMAGQRCEYIPGWDTHGLPIEQAVEKRLKEKKIDKRTLGREEFLERCRAYALEFVGIQAEEQKRMGLFARYDAPYLTLDFAYEAQEIRELAKFAARGMLYRKKKPVYWCLADQTALAEAEVEYDTLKTPSAYVAFRANADAVAREFPQLSGRKVDLVIWTTTPWTLPANLAIAVHPELEYVFYQLGERVVVVAKELLPRVLAEVKADELAVKSVPLPGGEVSAAALVDPSRILGYAQGTQLEGLEYAHPFLDDERVRRVILGEHVTLEAGTGLVHTAPGHGPDDYLVGLKYGLEAYNPVRNDGRYEENPFLEKVGLAGQKVLQANPLIMGMLADRGELLNDRDASVDTSYPHCWRCHNPVIYRATHQWFIPMDMPGTELRKHALDAIKQVKWVPTWGEHRITGMLENRPDWTISRQRTWGVPIPVAMCEGCDHAHVTEELMLKVADRVEKSGAGVWYSTPVTEFLPSPDFKCPECGKSEWRRETDILDVWFDSACSFSAVMEKRLGAKQVDLYLEGSDQHRGWFHSSLLVSVGTRGQPPYKTCLTHGFVVDAAGEKMSKSKGNVVPPEKVISQYGAEVLRLWVAASDYRDDVRLSDTILKGLSEAYRKIRNTLRYALSNLYDFDPAKDAVPRADLLPLDRWARARLADLVARVRKAYEAYEFHLVFAAVVDFCAVDLSALYFDILKDRLYTSKANGLARRSAQTVLHEIADTLLRLLAPLMSFTAEEAYGYLPGKREESVFFAGMPAAAADAKDEAVVALHEKLFAVRSAVQGLLEAARREKRIGASVEAQVVLTATGPARALLEAHLAELPGLFIVSQVKLAEAAGAGAQALELAQAVGAGSTVTAEVREAEGQKCPRCWTYDVQVGTPGHELCRKCEAALAP
ncbi:MAG: isoleucine--tRNA ligase [Myxococcaceae bacterium]|nr:isoleucine--tRNA ligase [Myxococcaceae bacterium]